jgi:negative regulator of sigma E activity
MKLIAAVAGGAIAMLSHGSKTAVRAAVTASPEPLSNIALSTGEDVLAVGLTWLTSRHPWVAATIAMTFILCAVLAARWIVRTLRRGWTRSPDVTTNAPVQ